MVSPNLTFLVATVAVMGGETTDSGICDWRSFIRMRLAPAIQFCDLEGIASKRETHFNKVDTPKTSVKLVSKLASEDRVEMERCAVEEKGCGKAMNIARATWKVPLRMTLLRNDANYAILSHTRKCLCVHVTRARCGVLFTGKVYLHAADLDSSILQE